jgi:hypothetical protein
VTEALPQVDIDLYFRDGGSTAVVTSAWVDGESNQRDGGTVIWIAGRRFVSPWPERDSSVIWKGRLETNLLLEPDEVRLYILDPSGSPKEATRSIFDGYPDLILFPPSTAVRIAVAAILRADADVDL